MISLTKEGHGLYHARFMSNPILINGPDFAREQRVLEGEIAVHELERLLDTLASSEGVVSYSLVGSVDSFRRPQLDLSVSGQVKVVCQRCLEAMDFPFASESRVTLFTNEAKLEAACASDESLDAILVEDELDVMALVEDEVLLGLPLSPVHSAPCKPTAAGPLGNAKPNPFAVLAKLKLDKSE